MKKNYIGIVLQPCILPVRKVIEHLPRLTFSQHKCLLILLLAVSLTMFFSSCKSTPQAEETPPAPVAETPAPEPTPPAPTPPAPTPPAPAPVSLDVLNQAIARADAARKRAVDFDSPAYFPSDWEAAEAKFTSAKNLPKGTAEDVQAAASACNDAAAGYDGLFDKTIPLYAQAREDEVIAARDELIATGVTVDYPEPLADADAIALQALTQYEAKDYYAARETAASALTRYRDLITAANAYLARQEIIDNSLESYDPDNLTRADEAGLAAVDAYEAGDMAAARDNADEALLRYNLVLNTGWASFITERGNSAGTERQKALDLKANVAVRDSFNAADALYNQAIASAKAEKFRDAVAQYRASEAQFASAGKAAEEKRRLAEDAIREAEEKMEASDEVARQAEIIIEGDSI